MMDQRPSNPPAAARDEPSLSPLRELQLVESAKGGNRDALCELLEGYQRRVYGLCYRMLRNSEEARDLTQDALIKVIEGLPTYDGRAALSTWIIRIAMNACLSHLRKEKLRRHASLDAPSAREGGASGGNIAATLEEDRELSTSERIEHRQQSRLLIQALDDLDVDSRSILVLRDVQDLEYQQISEVLDIPVGTVKSRLFRARAALRERMEQLQNQPRSAEPHPSRGP